MTQNTYASTITQTEIDILSQAVKDTPPGWQFKRENGYLYAWKDAWQYIYIAGKPPDPLRTETAQAMAERIGLYEVGRKLLKGREDEKP